MEKFRGSVTGVEAAGIPSALVAPLVESARQRWPNLKVDDGAFATFLWSRRPAQAEPGAFDWLEHLHAPDLYLVCASLSGDARAMGLLDELAGPVAREVVGRHPWCSVAAADLRTNLLSSLLVAECGRAPRLAQYGGRGSLASFLRVCAIRLALDDGNSHARQVPLDDLDLAARALGATADDEEVARLKELYRPAFEAVMRGTLGDLPARDRNLLRLHHVERLPCERIALLYKVHTATVWRWIDRIHRELRGEILRRLADKLGAEVGEAESILRLVWSHLDDSLRLALGDPPH